MGVSGVNRRRYVVCALLVVVVVVVLSVMGSGGSKFDVPPEEDALLTVLPADGTRGAPEVPVRASVLVWNMQKEQNSGWEAAFAQLARGRDLLLLQELHLRDDGGETAGWITQFGHRAALAASFYYARDNTATGTAVASLAEPIVTECQVTPDREPIVGTPKSAVIAEFALAGTPASKAASGDVGSTETDGAPRLLVASVHGINRASDAAFEAQLQRLQARLSVHTGPLILAGDFNTQSAHKTELLEGIAAKLGLAPVVFSPDERTLSKLSRRPLDHAYVRGASVDNATCWPSVHGSDHVAMTFDVLFDTS